MVRLHLNVETGLCAIPRPGKTRPAVTSGRTCESGKWERNISIRSGLLSESRIADVRGVQRIG